jgi:hypothetical protein
VYVVSKDKQLFRAVSLRFCAFAGNYLSGKSIAYFSTECNSAEYLFQFIRMGSSLVNACILSHQSISIKKAQGLHIKPCALRQALGPSGTALFTYPRYHHLYLVGFVPRRQADMGYVNIFEAGGFAAHGAYKVHVVIVVMSFLASAGAQGIAGGTLAVGNAVNDTLTGKYLQGAVNGHPVEIVERFFDIAMAQRAVRVLQKKV